MTRNHLNLIAEKLYGIEANAEGSPEQRFLAGWENASDVNPATEAEFYRLAIAELNNRRDDDDLTAFNRVLKETLRELS